MCEIFTPMLVDRAITTPGDSTIPTIIAPSGTTAPTIAAPSGLSVPNITTPRDSTGKEERLLLIVRFNCSNYYDY